MSGLPVTRRTLAWALVRNGATRPLNIAVGGAVFVAGLVLAWWLLPVALAVYLGLVLATALDADEAERVGRDTYARRRKLQAPAEPTSAAIAERLEPARVEEARIRAAISSAPQSLADVDAEVDRLMDAVRKLADRADQLDRYLREEDEQSIRRRLERLRAVQSGDATTDAANEQAQAALEEQLAARTQLARQLSRFDAQMEHIVATLGTIHAQIVRMSVEEEASEQARIAEQVRDLRREIGAAADAMRDAYTG